VDGVDGEPGRVQFNWALGEPPTVMTPAYTNVVATRGETLRWSIAVSGADPPAEIQWWLDERPVVGATNATVELVDVRESDSGLLWVQVSNVIEVVREVVATLTVEPPWLEVARSGFDNGNDGWGTGPGLSLMHRGLGGHPGGYLAAVGETGYWRAPGAYLGNQGVLYGGRLQFDLRQRGPFGLFSDQPLVVLEGGGMRLGYRSFANPVGSAGEWGTYRVPLKATEGWAKEDGSVVNETEMRAVLSSLTTVEIRGEVDPLLEETGLDNVLWLAAEVEEEEPVPVLEIWVNPSAGLVVLGWPVTETEYRLEVSDSLGAPDWQADFAVLAANVASGVNQVVVELDGGSRFFRLRKQ